MTECSSQLQSVLGILKFLNQLRIFSCPVRMSPLEVTSTNYSKPHVLRTRANIFSERIVNAWNFLPDIVDLSSLSRFKCSIHKVDFSKFLKCF